MQRIFMRIAVCFVSLPPALTAGQNPARVADDLAVPWALESFAPGSGCQWSSPEVGGSALRRNAHYIAPPAKGQQWEEWLQALRAYRRHVREHLHDSEGTHIQMRFDGVRAWVRTGTAWAYAADLSSGEHVVIRGQAKWVEGNATVCLALDYNDRERGADGSWRGWSTVLASTTIPQDGTWHDFHIAVDIPSFDRKSTWARPILGMDGTFDKTPGAVLLRQVEVVMPGTPQRAERFAELRRQLVRPAPFDDAIYRRDDLKWMTRNFVCGFLFMYDRAFWDPDRAEYRVEALCQEVQQEFGGYDSVVLWHDYPRIGADDRNQFDFFRHMPGGLEGLRDVVVRFRQLGVKVFIPYMPWDVGTRREEVSDERALAEIVKAIEADGIFLDTMRQSPPALRETIDAARAGVAFAPEGHPSIPEMERCSGSWAQWLQPFPGIGVLHLKWIEPRHMQHQIRRWDKSHQDELAAAWINGSGILVWENVFGSFNPWNAEDRATLRRMAPVLRHFADLLTEGEWLPCFPVQSPGVVACCWQNDQVRLWTIVKLDGSAGDRVLLDVEARGQKFFDLWSGVSLTSSRTDEKVRLEVPLERFTAIAALAAGAEDEPFQRLLEKQSREAARRMPDEDLHVRARDVVQPEPPPAVSRALPEAEGMLSVDGGEQEFVVRHMRRECGCYPDPGTPPESYYDFLKGVPHNETLVHHVTATVGSFSIDPQPVTNAQFEAFLKATGYRPPCSDRFLDHWGGRTCPPELRDEPVVNVDLDDARAYAAWSGRRLPTEWEWQLAAERHGGAFHRDQVHEWTESLRDDGHVRFVMLRGGCRYEGEGSIWYFPGGPQPISSHAKFLLLYPGLDRCRTIGFRCVAPMDPSG
jgi:hypothetical protein